MSHIYDVHIWGQCFSSDLNCLTHTRVKKYQAYE